MLKISREVSSKVLTIGSQYIDHRGGIGGVISFYSKFFSPFNYICSYSTTTNTIVIVLNFLWSIILLFKVLLINRSIEIVHIHGAAKGSFFRKYILFNISKRIFSKITIFHSHSSEMEIFFTNSSSFVKSLLNDFFNNCDQIICLSKSWEDFYLRNFNPRSVVILENITENFGIQLPKLIEQFPIRILFLGYIGRRKGIFDFLEMINNNRMLFESKIELYIGGNGEVDKLKSFITYNNLDSFVFFEGWVSGEKKLALLRNCDIYVLPSYNEGLPLSILEAMSFGMPIMSTTVGGIPEVVTNGINGFLVEPGDIEGYRDCLLKFTDGVSLVSEFGMKSLDKVKPYYPDSVIPKLESIYRNLLI